jgi:nucleotide-binding universal stress UspA family protein
MTIVCATHFSKSSFGAVRAAAALASVHGEKLCLLTVVPPGQPRPTEEQLLTCSLELQALALRDEGIEAEFDLLQGTLAKTVQEFCEQRAASLLIVDDSTDPTPSLLGSPLQTFKADVDVPLLVVRDPRPFEAWVHGPAPMKVLLALDHTWSASVALDWISQLARFGPVDLVVAFIWWPAEELTRQPAAHRATPEATHAAMAEGILRQLAGALRPLPDNVSVRVHLELGAEHVAERLSDLAALEQVDLFVLGSHPVTGPIARMRALTSVSQGVISNAPMSVACIPSRVARSVETQRASTLAAR